MKAFKILFIGLLGIMLFASPAVSGVERATHFSQLEASAIVATVVVLSVLFKKKNDVHTFTSAIQVELWVSYIIDRLYKDNQFLKYAWNDDDKVIGGKVVHIPNPGARPTVVKNRSSF